MTISDLPVPSKRGDITTIVPGRSAPAYLWPSLENMPADAYLYPQLMSAHEETMIGRTEAVRQARQAERKSELLRGGINRKTNTVVGADLRVQLTPDWRGLGLTADWAHEFARAGEALIRSWSIDRRKVCDTEGHNTFGGLMWLAFRNVVGPDGETFGIIHYDTKRAKALGTKWATSVTVLDPQRVKTPPEYTDNADIVDGKLVDPYGRMLGYYFDSMPRGVDLTGTASFQYVPRETPAGRPMGWHYFSKTRGAMQRGITSLVNMLDTSNNLTKFDKASLGAAIVAAAMATYVETGGSSEEARENLAPAVGFNPLDGYGNRIEFYDKMKLRIGPARIPVLPTGDKIHIEATDRSNMDPTAFRKGPLREFASALNMTGEQLSLDYSDVNYSSARAAIVDIQRGVVAERSFFFPAVPALIVDAIIEEAVVKGWLPVPGGTEAFYANREAFTRCNFTGPAMGWVDPQKEAMAAILRIDPNNPLSTLSDEAAAQGYSFEEIVDTRSREQDMLLAAGLITSKAPAPMPGQQAGSEPQPPSDPAPKPEPRN